MNRPDLSRPDPCCADARCLTDALPDARADPGRPLDLAAIEREAARLRAEAFAAALRRLGAWLGRLRPRRSPPGAGARPA